MSRGSSRGRGGWCITPRLRGLGAQAQGRQQIGAEIHRQDLQHREGGRNPQHHHRQERHDLRHVRGQDVGDELADVRHHRAAETHGLDDRREVVVEQHDVGSFAGHVGAGDAHGQAHIGSAQGRCVVDAIAGDGYHFAQGLISLHEPQFLFRGHAGEHQPVAIFEQLA